MIRFIDNEKLTADYQKACDFDNVFGTINSFLFKKHSNQNSGYFWNLYNDNDELLGNLSFANNTFTICVKDDSCSEELAQFIDFWGNFSFISYNKCNVINLDKMLSAPSILSCGAVLCKNTNEKSKQKSVDICKDINLYSAFCFFKETFPEKLNRVSFENFNYDMNFRLRRQESFLYGVVLDGVLASALEVMCKSQNNIVLGCLATDEKYRKNGFASSLLDNLSAEFPKSSLYVFAENDFVTQFYKKLGFIDHAVWAQITPARKD